MSYYKSIPDRYFKCILYAGRGNKYRENQVLSKLNIDTKISFNINNTVSGAMQEANINITGLKVETMSYLSTSFSPWIREPVQNKIELYAGYENRNGLIFSGNIIDAIPNFDNAEYNIQLKAITAFPVLLNTIKSYSFEGEQDLIYILEQINKDLQFTFVKSLNKQYKVYNYCYNNTSIINHLRNLADITNTNIYIDTERLIVSELNEPVKQYRKIKLDLTNIVGAIKPNMLGCELDIKMNTTLRTGQEVEINSLIFPQLNKTTFIIQTIGHIGDTKSNTWITHLQLLKKENYE